MSQTNRKKIAVIGAGISGLGAAYFLARRHDVVLFEQDSRPGGHVNTVVVNTPEGARSIDTGFIVLNPATYPNLYGFFDELSVARQDTAMGLGVSVGNGRIEYSDHSPFAQRRLLFSPSHLKMFFAMFRFNHQVKELLAEDRLPNITLGEFLEKHRYPMSLRVRYIAALAGPIWSVSPRGAMEFPFPTFAHFFQSHGLLNVFERPQWQVVRGGSRTYVDTALKSFRGELRLATPVQRLQRVPGGVKVTTPKGEEQYDVAICATHPRLTDAMLSDATAAERGVLSVVTYDTNTVYLHTDENLMPRNRRVWSSWNTILAQDALTADPIGVTYWMNHVQTLGTKTQYFVSLNPPRPVKPEAIVYQVRYEHPHYNAVAVGAQERLPKIQGSNGIWFAGAWTGYGFHEDGLKSGLRCVAGIDRDCVPNWATGL